MNLGTMRLIRDSRVFIDAWVCIEGIIISLINIFMRIINSLINICYAVLDIYQNMPVVTLRCTVGILCMNEVQVIIIYLMGA